MDFKTLKGIAVVAISDGARLGSVHDVLFDLDKRYVRAFIVGDGGFLSSHDRILDMTEVNSIGTDAVMIDSRDQLIADRNDARYQSYANVSKAGSLRVVSESGVLIGNLASVQFEPTDGRFTDIEVSRHGIFAPFRANLTVPAESVVRFGQDVVVVPDQYVEVAADETASEDSEQTTAQTGSNQVDAPPTG